MKVKVQKNSLCWAVLVLVLALAAVVGCVLAAEESTSTTTAAAAATPPPSSTTPPPMVPITLLPSAVQKGAVCMDGTAPAYHFHPGSGAGNNSWIVNLEGGGWCNNMRTCKFRAKTHHGSSNYMEKQLAFTGILSNNSAHNPDFYSWNRVKIRYCDSASFAGEGFDKNSGLYFRGQRIWAAAIQHLMSMGMASADQVLLSGCSAGGLAAILHCDELRAAFPAAGGNTTVKCFADGGLFLDAVDVAGGHSLRSYFGDVVTMQGVAANLPQTCTDHLDATSCFFPQNLIDSITTPMFLLNAAYDVWQIQESLAPNKVDPASAWHNCKFNHSACNASQLTFLQGFRDQMIGAVKDFSESKNNGLFINSCFAHCQSEIQDIWYADGSPAIQNKGIAKSVGDWYFERAEVKAIDCPYPCDKTCRHLF